MVPAPRRSIVPTVPGVPAWGAVLIAVGLTFVGFLIDAARGTDLTRAFGAFYLCGCVVALCAVRYRGLFTAVVQPPLLLFVAVPLAYQYFIGGSGASVKDLLLNVAIPLVNRFPLMLLATVVSIALGALRVYLARRGPAVAAPSQPRVARSGGGIDESARRNPVPTAGSARGSSTPDSTSAAVPAGSTAATTGAAEHCRRDAPLPAGRDAGAPDAAGPLPRSPAATARGLTSRSVPRRAQLARQREDQGLVGGGDRLNVGVAVFGEQVEHPPNQYLGNRRAGGDADRAHAVEPRGDPPHARSPPDVPPSRPH